LGHEAKAFFFETEGVEAFTIEANEYFSQLQYITVGNPTHFSDHFDMVAIALWHVLQVSGQYVGGVRQAREGGP